MRIVTLLILALAGPAAADVFMFQTPSGNIVCSVGREPGFSDVACSIATREGPPAMPRPPGCAGPWGHRFVMTDRDPPYMECGAPMAGSGVEVAPYGETGTFGGITCESSRAGLSCRNARGHGFFLSRARQSVF